MVFLTDKKMHSDDETKGPFPPTFFLSLTECGKNSDKSAAHPLSYAPFSGRLSSETAIQIIRTIGSFHPTACHVISFHSTFSTRQVSSL